MENGYLVQIAIQGQLSHMQLMHHPHAFANFGHFVLPLIKALLGDTEVILEIVAHAFFQRFVKVVFENLRLELVADLEIAQGNGLQCANVAFDGGIGLERILGTSDSFAQIVIGIVNIQGQFLLRDTDLVVFERI